MTEEAVITVSDYYQMARDIFTNTWSFKAGTHSWNVPPYVSQVIVEISGKGRSKGVSSFGEYLSGPAQGEVYDRYRRKAEKFVTLNPGQQIRITVATDSIITVSLWKVTDPFRFSVPGTYELTIPERVNRARVSVKGGGGGGRGAGTSSSFGNYLSASGGGGIYHRRTNTYNDNGASKTQEINIRPGEKIMVAVGRGALWRYNWPSGYHGKVEIQYIGFTQ